MGRSLEVPVRPQPALFEYTSPPARLKSAFVRAQSRLSECVSSSVWSKSSLVCRSIGLCSIRSEAVTHNLGLRPAKNVRCHEGRRPLSTADSALSGRKSVSVRQKSVVVRPKSVVFMSSSVAGGRKSVVVGSKSVVVRLKSEAVMPKPARVRLKSVVVRTK